MLVGRRARLMTSDRGQYVQSFWRRVMTTVGQTPGDQRRAPVSGAHTARAKLVAAALLAAIVRLFAVLNSQSVRVHFLVTTAHLPMTVVIAVCAVIGLAVGWLIGRRRAVRGTGS